MKAIKEGDVRKREILVTARNLFIQKGYEHTSVNDILRIVDIAKGTFYYYFESKEEVLEAIILDIVAEGVLRAESIVKDSSLPVLKRLLMAIMAQAPDFEGSDAIKKTLHKVENAKFEQLYRKTLLKQLTPVLHLLILEGMEQNVFQIAYPVECTETILLLGHMMFDCDLFEWNEKETKRKIQAFLWHTEKMLGVREGTMQDFMQLFEQKNS